MTAPLSPVLASRLEKAAVDNGFDRELPREGDWLGYASTHCPLRIWLGVFGDAGFADEARRLLGLERPLRFRGLADGHRAHLPWHREPVFRRGDAGGSAGSGPPPRNVRARCAHRARTFLE